ncbi:hypothetical protein [Streptomyces sp. DH12]|uniref:hypothetical protein n=1 Tax=Streptomyces sp. DH12 TaxID=2857010 RepID=UPI001E2D40BE|nr:hypothetical protein [Streptomyces sp. DH12]
MTITAPPSGVTHTASDLLEERPLTNSQITILVAAAIPMLVVGGLGAWGTYTNIKREFPQDTATALGVVAAGEGATLVLALLMVGLTLLGQSSPAIVRLGLWLLPAIASGTGAIVADGTEEAVVNAVTPMAMSAAAEGIGLLARRIVIYRTRIDMEAQRRNAAIMQRLAVQRALAANHPWKMSRKRAELASWRLIRKVGVGDDELGADLVTVQRQQLTAGANTALAGMFSPAVTPALTAGAPRDTTDTPTVTVPASTVTDTDIVTPVTGSVTPTVTQVSADPGTEPSHRPSRLDDTVTDAPVTEESTVTEGTVTAVTAPQEMKTGVTLAEVAAVAGVTTPAPGERLSNDQLVVVLRHLRYSEDPPLSYRQAADEFRGAGYVGSENRVRKAWGVLMSNEETADDTKPRQEAADTATVAVENSDEDDDEEPVS